MVISDKFKIGEVVYLVTDQDQNKRIVSGLLIRSGGLIEYELSCGVEVSFHIEVEITKAKTYV